MSASPAVLCKATRISEYFNSNLTADAMSAVQLINLGLEEVTLYNGFERSPSSIIIKDAEVNISNYLKTNNVAANLFSEFPLAHMSTRSFPNKDAVDLRVLVGGTIDLNVVIEFDTIRADQVSKKFVSRIATIKRENLIYIAFCYPGTEAMNKAEVAKYFGFMRTLAEDLQLAGFIGMCPRYF